MRELPAVGELARTLAALPLPARVAIDGVDAAGKTTLADRLAAHLPGAERLCADDFLRPADERYRQGRESPVGYYEDSFDYARLREAVLTSEDLLIVDGVFLQRPELNDLWDFRVFIQIEPGESIRRGVTRDGPETAELYEKRYVPGQRLYLESVRPSELADVVVLSLGGAGRRG